MSKEQLHRDLPTFSNQLREWVGEEAGYPPVDAWHPEREGSLDIRIDVNGRWFYQGDAMERMPVVRLLSRILRKDGDAYFLVSPAEKMKIQVEDVPFVVPMLDIEGQGCAQKLHMTTQTGDCFSLGRDHPLVFRKNDQGDDVPYVLVRSGMYARLNRSVYYELANIVESHDKAENGSELWGVWSCGEFFNFPID